MFIAPPINSAFMAQGRAKPATVSAAPLFDWFKAEKSHRGRLRAAGYTDGRITNWKKRGIPRAEVPAVAGHMGLTFEQYLVKAGEQVHQLEQPASRYGTLSEDALEIARAFDKMQPQTRERVREHVFIYSVIDRSFPWLRSGKPVSDKYDAFEKWHAENLQTALTLEAARIVKFKPDSQK